MTIPNQATRKPTNYSRSQLIHQLPVNRRWEVSGCPGKTQSLSCTYRTKISSVSSRINNIEKNKFIVFRLDTIARQVNCFGDYTEKDKLIVM